MVVELFPAEHLFNPFDVPERVDDIRRRLANVPTEPLTPSHLNQLLHLSHQAGVTRDFFEYYFLQSPGRHPHRVAEPPNSLPKLDQIDSYEQLRWGLDRFAVDAALYWGDFKNAYRALRDLSLDEIQEFFSEHCVPSEWMRLRGPVMPLVTIDIDSRPFVSELACKVLDVQEGAFSEAHRAILSAFRAMDEHDSLSLSAIVQDIDVSGRMHIGDGIRIAFDSYMNRQVNGESELLELLRTVEEQSRAIREKAQKNTELYLSICNELDVYVATSMRTAEDFRNTGRVCERIFGSDALRGFDLRWFNPTISACDGHQDKGLVECLMVDQARVVLYFAGITDSWGKDAEAVMALSRGKPVIILCPDNDDGQRRAQIFRDIHPLSRITDYVNGVAVGAIITTNENEVIELMQRHFENRMTYDAVMDDKGFYVKEELTGSVVRTVTRFQMLRESFWNYYNRIP